MNYLGELKHLRELVLVQTKVDDAGMEALVSLTSLEELSLEESKITNHGLEFVGQLSELRLLTIHNNNAVDENGLIHLENLKKLKTLYLCVSVTKKGIASLKKLAALENLYMGDIIMDTPFNHERLGRELPGVGLD